MAWLKEAGLALKAATLNADIIKARAAGFLAVKTKESARDVVTELDGAIEKGIIAVLKGSRFDVIAEESAGDRGCDMPPKDPTWFVDPIDGTANFVSSIPFYSISVGLAKKDRFIVGAVVVPEMKEIFFTHGDEAAYLNGKRIIAGQDDMKSALIAASFSSVSQDAAQRRKEYEVFGKINDAGRGCLRLGAASVNICYVAANRLSGAYGIAAKIWDVAGAMAIASRAGCKIYVEWIAKTNRVNYIVGTPFVADEIADYLAASRIANLKELVVGK